MEFPDDAAVPTLGSTPRAQAFWRVPEPGAGTAMAEADRKLQAASGYSLPGADQQLRSGKGSSRGAQEPVSANSGGSLAPAEQPLPRHGSYELPMNDLHAWLSAPQPATASDSQDWQALLKVPHANSEDSAAREVPDTSATSQGALHTAAQQPARVTHPADESDAQSTSAWSSSKTSAHDRHAKNLPGKVSSIADFAVPELCHQHEQLFDTNVSLDPLAASEQDLDLFLPSLASSDDPCSTLPADDFKLPAAEVAAHPPACAAAGAVPMVHVPDQMLQVQQRWPIHPAWAAQACHEHQQQPQQQRQHQQPPSATALGIPYMPHVQPGMPLQMPASPSGYHIPVYTAGGQYVGHITHPACAGFVPAGPYPMLHPCAAMPVPAEMSHNKRASRLEICREKKRNRTSGIKIRYHMRQLTAHMRPRLRGRFVKSSTALAAAAAEAEGTQPVAKQHTADGNGSGMSSDDDGIE